MTSKISWFNAGIYKNTIRRFKWGSLIYFILLFFAVPFPYLTYDSQSVFYSFRYESEAILGSSMTFPFLLTLGVPIVVAVLIHRYMHESRQSIAVHSLPVTRLENYVSNILAAFTLMFTPVILTGVIMLVMSLTGYSVFFSPVIVLYWIALNITLLFIMFSVSSFAAFFTGNAVAHIAITAGIHLLPLMLALTIILVSEAFLYGFFAAENFIATVLANKTPIVWLSGRVLSNAFKHGFFSEPQLWVFTGIAVVLYILGFVAYKKRKVETCGDVAAFKFFRPVLKYGVTAAVAVVVLGMLYATGVSAILTFCTVIILCAIAYFAVEMFLSKSLKVFGKYKGYIGFCVVMAAITAFCAFTDMFGYETRVPENGEILSAAIYSDGTYIKPLIDDEDFINKVTEIHKEIVKNPPVISREVSFDDNKKPMRSMRISYVLKNGKTLERRYKIQMNEYDDILCRMFENETYRLKTMNVYYLDETKAENIRINIDFERIGNDEGFNLTGDEAKEFLSAMKQDIKNLPYEKLHPGYSENMRIRVGVEVRNSEEKIGDILRPSAENHYYYIPQYFNFELNSNYKNSIAFLERHEEYMEDISVICDNLYVFKEPADVEGYNRENLEINVSFEGKSEYVLVSECEKLDPEDAMKFLWNESFVNTDEEMKLYAVYCFEEPEASVGVYDYLGLVSREDMPEYIKKDLK